jgi:hypothetical protein
MYLLKKTTPLSPEMAKHCNWLADSSLCRK